MAPPPFLILEPEVDSPVLVEVPHAGTYVDPETSRLLMTPARAVAQDADLLVDELYADAPSVGATLLAAKHSRYVVDLNRGEGDVDGASVRGVPGPLRASRGVIWRLSGAGEPVLAAPLERAELERRLTRVYRPYHEALAGLIAGKVRRFGHAVVVAAHSMPSVGVTSRGARALRADVVPGTRGRTSAAARYIDVVDAKARSAGLTVAHDNPYRGGFTTLHYGAPARGVHVVQVELARRLYMDEATLQPSPRFMETRRFCRELTAALVELSRS